MGMSDLLGPQGGAAALKDAMDNVDVGVKKQAVAKAKAEDAPTPPKPTAEPAPNKFNVQHKDGENDKDFIDRVVTLRGEWEDRQKK